MATWIVHLRLAERLLPLIRGLDEAHFAMGSVAPDSGIPDENWETFDPPPEILHFHVGDSERRQCADLEFYRRHLAPLRPWNHASPRFSFLLGYFFHLATDNLWNVEIGIPTKARFAAEFDADPQFIWQVKRDWYGLDFAYVRRERASLFWRVFLHSSYTDDFLDFLPREAIKQRLEYIKAFYQRTDAELEEWYIKRPNLYLTEEAMDRFVTEGVTTLSKAFQYLQQDPDTSDLYSILEFDA
jgi:hypothetical protein